MLSSVPTTPTYARFLGYGSRLGGKLVDNDQLIEMNGLDVDAEWILRRCGIQTRGYIAEGEELEDLAASAALQAIQNSGLQPEDIDAIIMATDSSPVQSPSLGALIGEMIGARGAAAYDVTSGCAAWGVITAQGEALIAAGTAKHVLLISGEVLSNMMDPKDLATAILFSDGVGAAVMGVSEEPGISPTVWGSDGSKWDVINMTMRRTEARQSGLPDLIKQEGQTVYRWAAFEVPKIAQQVLDAAGVSADEIAAFIPHQANERILDMFVKKLGLPETCVVSKDVITSGNTSAGTIPIATHHLLEQHPELSGKLALQIGFGAGLTWAGQVIRLP